MADKYLTPNLTKEGLSLVIRSLHGETITFTKLVLGNGKPENLEDVKAVSNPLLDVPFVEKESKEDYLLLVGETSSSSIDSSFYGNELGVYAQDSTGKEYLYAYRYAEKADFFPSSQEGRSIELRITVVVQVGNSENVTAILTEGEAYALKSDFNAHKNDNGNPHNVTKEQIGLSNVPNVTTNNQTPTFTQASTRTNISSGETLSTIFGKIAKLFSDFASHLSARNPHNIDCDGIGASAKNHLHSTSDINSGILSVERGGTGTYSLSTLKRDMHSGLLVENSAYSTKGLVKANYYKSICMLTLSKGIWIIVSDCCCYDISSENSFAIECNLTHDKYNNTKATSGVSPVDGCKFMEGVINFSITNFRRVDIIQVYNNNETIYLTMMPEKNSYFYGDMKAVSIG